MTEEKKVVMSAELREFLTDKGIISSLGEPQFLEDRNYFDFATDVETQISYIRTPGGLQYFNDDDFFNKDIRARRAVRLKPAKLLKKWYPSVKDNVIRDSAGLFGLGERKLEVTDEVKKYYLEDSYEGSEKSSSLWNSCMKHDQCQSFIEFYEEIGAKMLILKGADGKIGGRAIIWKGEFKQDGKKKLVPKTLMDRVYFNDDGDLSLFLDYAKDKGWLRRVCQDYEQTSEFMDENRNVLQGKFFFDTGMKWKNTKGTIHLRDIDDDKFPWLDTLQYIDIEGKLSNKKQSKVVARCQDTGGGSNIINKINKKMEIVKNSYFSDFYDDYIDEKKTVESVYHKTRILKKDKMQIFYKDDFSFVSKDYAKKHGDEFIKHDGKLRHVSEIVKCTIKDKMIAVQDCPVTAEISKLSDVVYEARLEEWENYKRKFEIAPKSNKIKGSVFIVDANNIGILDFAIANITGKDMTFPSGNRLFSTEIKSFGKDDKVKVTNGCGCINLDTDVNMIQTFFIREDYVPTMKYQEA